MSASRLASRLTLARQRRFVGREANVTSLGAR